MSSIMQTKPKIIVIIGPTASGKTGLGIQLARQFNGEIISADSRQVYRGMDIGTGKDLDDYVINDKFPISNSQTIKIPYHLIDVVEPTEVYDLARYKRDAETAIADILERDKLPIVVGGSGLYLEALVNNFSLSTIKADLKLRDRLEAMSLEEVFDELNQKNPSFVAKINHSDRHNKRRLIRYVEVFAQSGSVSEKGEVKYDALIIGLDWPRAELNQRIHTRLMQRLDEQDMVEEVNNLNRQGVTWERLESFGLEYKFISWYLQEKLDYDEMVSRLETAICQFAKRQMTWFRRWSKSGAKIHWLTASELPDAEQLVTKHLQ